MPSRLKELMDLELERRYSDCSELLVVGANKLSANEVSKLRCDLREKNIEMVVVRNSMADRVLSRLGMGKAVNLLSGPCALVRGECELPLICKAVVEAAKKYEEKLVIRGGFATDQTITVEVVKRWAGIPPLPVLHAQIVGGIQSPVTGVASAFQSILRGLACALEGIRKQKEEGGFVPATA